MTYFEIVRVSVLKSRTEKTMFNSLYRVYSQNTYQLSTFSEGLETKHTTKQNSSSEDLYSSTHNYFEVKGVGMTCK